jgi:hypothetical protein
MEMKKDCISPRCMSCDSEWELYHLCDSLNKRLIETYLEDRLLRIEKNLISLLDIEKAKKLQIKRDHKEKYFLDVQELREKIETLKEKARLRRCVLQRLDPNKGYYIGYNLYHTIQYLDEVEYEEYVNYNKKLDSLRYELRCKLENVTKGGVEKKIRCLKIGCGSFMVVKDEYKDMVCITCGNIVCNVCLNDKGLMHECIGEDVKSVTYVKVQTKSCPNCDVPIFKIDGCDQMWCTQCHASFSWKSGKKTGYRINHNPHFLDYMRDKGIYISRDAMDAPCGGLPELREEEKCSLYKNVKYIRDVVLRKMQNKLNKMDKNDDLRLKFLVGDINEEYFKKVLTKRYCEDRLNTDVYPILETYCVVLEEAFRNKKNNEYMLKCNKLLKNELENVYKKHRCKKKLVII